MIFDEVKKEIESESNSNFHWDRLTWVEQIWIHKICEVMDRKLDAIQKELKERIIL